MPQDDKANSIIIEAGMVSLFMCLVFGFKLKASLYNSPVVGL
jgi:hypothetical protein